MEINIMEPQELLKTTISTVIKATTKKFFKDGVELEKGALITQRRIERNRKLYEHACEHWSIYPDCFIDLITPSHSKFKLYFYQRYFLRLCMRYGRTVVIAPRALKRRCSIKSLN